ncbi:hypothetical protein LSCM1_03781 [Leishmania martiniquensis]|uniref:Uncharacterized protein n=1 Tax=Leishmania martiniquensis TaxID=1580590 RepID=A0A836GR07_9TRYP|nr:hypothetical protein LSCM1_03781 [Leishmania martiniquensis]
MRTNYPLRCLRHSHLFLARRGHGGTAQAQRELERLAVMEQFMSQPAESRARQAPATTEARAAAYLRGLPQRVELTRRVASRAGDVQALDEHSAIETSSSAASPTAHWKGRTSSGEAAAPEVTTLSQFLSLCKKHRIQFSSSTDPASRKQGREAFRSFWSRHVSSAVACCYERVHDLGCVADIGLSDTELHLSMHGMRSMLHVLQTERTTVSSLDATRILGYLARELQYYESRKDNERDGSVAPASVSLTAFREALTDVALRRLASLFMQQSPLAESHTPSVVTMATNEPGACDAAHPPELVSGVDAVWGLEVLSVVHARDATEAVLEDLWNAKQLRLLRQQREPKHLRWSSSLPEVSSASLPMSALANEIQYLLVSELFRVVAALRHDLRMTDIVHAYALLRVHLHLLWPPYAQQPAYATQRPNRGRAPLKREESHAASASPPAPARRRALWYEKDMLFRVTWGLAVALVSKDRVFISSYHFLKIVAALAKLPAFVLSQEPRVKKELRSFESLHGSTAAPSNANGENAEGRYVSANMAAEVVRQEMAAEAGAAPTVTVALHPSDFWDFMIAKACVFVPNLTPEQRRIVCRSFHLAITEKRAHLLSLRTGANAGVARVPQSSRRIRSVRAERRFGCKIVLTASSSDGAAAEIIRPLVEEMEDYPEPYEVCVRSRRAHPSPLRVAPAHRRQ